VGFARKMSDQPRLYFGTLQLQVVFWEKGTKPQLGHILLPNRVRLALAAGTHQAVAGSLRCHNPADSTSTEEACCTQRRPAGAGAPRANNGSRRSQALCRKSTGGASGTGHGRLAMVNTCRSTCRSRALKACFWWGSLGSLSIPCRMLPGGATGIGSSSRRRSTRR
jgi:hypothetical protein